METQDLTQRQLILISIGKHLPIAMFINYFLVAASYSWLSNEWWLIILAFAGYTGFEIWQKKQGGSNTWKHQLITIAASLLPYVYFATLISGKYF